MAEHEEQSARVTITMVYKEQREMKEMLIAMRSDQVAQKAMAQDHEARIRVLEQFRWLLLGVAMASGGLGAMLTKYLGN